MFENAIENMKIQRQNLNRQTDRQTVAYKKPGFWTCAGGFIAGDVAAGLVATPVKLINPRIMNKLKKMNVLPEDEFAKASAGINKTLVKTGLAKKGVEILRTTNENTGTIQKLFTEEFNKAIKIPFLPKKAKKFVSNLMAGIMTNTVKKGQNAMYLFKAKKIVAPEKDLILTTFHEMGHAVNGNFSKIGKMLQKTRGLTLLAAPITLIGLLKTKKAPDEKPKGWLDKTMTFVKDNAGKLTFLAFVPMLAEEAMASIKGNKFAKQVLEAPLAKKVAKTNGVAYLTYLGLALASSLSIAAGIKVKDAIAKPKLVEQN